MVSWSRDGKWLAASGWVEISQKPKASQKMKERWQGLERLKWGVENKRKVSENKCREQCFLHLQSVESQQGNVRSLAVAVLGASAPNESVVAS